MRRLAMVGLAASMALASASARAAEPAFDAAKAPFVLEAHTGRNHPLGWGGLVLMYDRGRRWSGGAGVGPDGLALLGRFAVVRAGPFSAGLAATLSGANREVDRLYWVPDGQTPSETSNRMVWSWRPGYRATAAVGAQLASRRWSLRLEAGIAYLLNDPTCRYVDDTSTYEGDCDSPLVPAPYHFAVEPGRVIPSVTGSLGYRFGVEDPDDVPVQPWSPQAANASAPVSGGAWQRRSPGTARALALGMTLGAVGLGALSFASVRSDEAFLAAFVITGIGLGIAPSAGHFYASERRRGLVTAGLRLGLLTVASIVIIDAWASRAVEYPRMSAGDAQVQLALGLTFVAASVGVAIYDIVDAPRAARRQNARHGLPEIALAPWLASHGAVTSQGVAAQGRF